MSEQQAQKKMGNEAPEKQAEMIAHLSDLQNNEGWKLLMRVFDQNINYLQELILEKKWVDGSDATEGQVDLLRAKYGYLKDLQKSPKNLTEQLKVQPEAVVDDLDPYYSDMKDVNLDREKTEQDG